MAIVKVASDKNPEVQYEVDPEAGTCTCPHYQNKLKALNEQRASEIGYVKSMDAVVCKHVRLERERANA